MRPFHSNVTPGRFVTILCVGLCTSVGVFFFSGCARLISRAVHALRVLQAVRQIERQIVT